jgi:hypothetical protein
MASLFGLVPEALADQDPPPKRDSPENSSAASTDVTPGADLTTEPGVHHDEKQVEDKGKHHSSSSPSPPSPRQAPTMSIELTQPSTHKAASAVDPIPARSLTVTTANFLSLDTSSPKRKGTGADGHHPLPSPDKKGPRLQSSEEQARDAEDEERMVMSRLLQERARDQMQKSSKTQIIKLGCKCHWYLLQCTSEWSPSQPFSLMTDKIMHVDHIHNISCTFNAIFKLFITFHHPKAVGRPKGVPITDAQVLRDLDPDLEFENALDLHVSKSDKPTTERES